MVLQHIDVNFLSKNPLNFNQHAFRKGSSCDSALSDMVDDIESSTLRGNHALGVFLDIEGAFDNLLPSAAIQGMRRKGLPEYLIKWYAHYLRGRSISIDVKGVIWSRRLTKGTPQGGVLSPLIWNMAFDGLIDLFNTGPVHCKGFADDAALVIRGIDPGTMADQMQKALNTASKWGEDNKLNFSNKKTVVVFFSRSTKVKLPRKLKLKGEVIEYSDSAKYLGITLDNKLDFSVHIKQKINAAKALMFKIRASIGQFWGPAPFLSKWAYTAIVRPMLTYGSVVWGHHTTPHLMKFTRLNRMAVKFITFIPPSAPSLGLEMLLDIMPLDLLIQGLATHTAMRLRGRNPTRWDGLGTRGRIGHVRRHKNELNKVNWGEVPNDEIPCFLQWTPPFLNVLEETSNIPLISVRTQPCPTNNAHCFISGSKIRTQGPPLHGWASVIVSNGIPMTQQGVLGKHNNLMQTRLYAVTEAAKAALPLQTCGLVLHIDDFHVAGLLGRTQQNTRMVRDCLAALKSLSELMTVYICTSGSHEWSAMARRLSMEAALNQTPVTPTICPISKETAQSIVLDRLHAQWNTRWLEYVHARQTKLFVSRVNVKLSHRLLRLDRASLSLVILCVTGHNFLNYHKHNMSRSETDRCRFCLEGREDSWHLVTQCPAFDDERQLHLHDKNRHRLKEQRILQYLKATGIDKCMMGTLETHLSELAEPSTEVHIQELSNSTIIPHDNNELQL